MKIAAPRRPDESNGRSTRRDARPGVRRWLAAIALAVATGRAFGAPAPDVADVAPADRAARAENERIEALAARSADLRMRILFSYDFDPSIDGRLSVRESTSVETLIDQARGATDPLTLSLLLFRCDLVRQRAPCDRVDLARRWTLADTQNQVAWLTLATELHRAGDTDGAGAAFLRAARASTWRDPSVALPRLIASQLMADPIGMASGDAVVYALGIAAATPAPLHTISAACKGAPERQDACARIVETMARDGDSLMELSVAAAYAARSTLPSTTVEAARREADAAWWAMAALLPAYDDGRPRDASGDARLRLQAELGERRFYRRMRENARISDAEAAKRYVATLSADGLANREHLQPFVSMPRTAGW